jgi:hypothetical protein
MRSWPTLRRRIARSQELRRAATFLAVGGYEALEMGARAGGSPASCTRASHRWS